MIAAAADPGLGTTFTFVSALSAVAVGMSLAGLLIYAAWSTRGGRKGFVERWLDSRLARRAARALDNGDANVLRAVTERDTHRERVTVPRQLTERPHR